jgi:type III restriction enzyme
MQVAFWFEAFELQGLQSISLQPDSPELITQNLRTGTRTVISREQIGVREARPEDYVVRELILLPEIDYAAHSTLLYNLAEQVTTHLRSYLPDEDAVFSVVERFGRWLAEFVFTQMKQHMRRTKTTYKISVGSDFADLKAQHYNGAGHDVIRNFRQPLERPSEIKRFVFSGFTKCCYHLTKFDSDQGERRMAIMLEDEPTVLKWMKPGPGQFRLEDADGNPYQPDFVVETTTEKLIIEPKQKDRINDPEVRRKAETAMLWCDRANEHYAKVHGEKSWRYVLVPHDEITASATLAGLLAAFTKVPDMDLLSRYEVSN